jgi:protein-L-isoaspartate(D-aspartate) O-methyltransferase
MNNEILNSELSAASLKDASALHQALVDQMKQSGVIQSPRVEAAFVAVPRHLFLPDVPIDQVYQDDAVVTKKQDEISISSSTMPSLMAMMLEQLRLEPGHRVLEIGAGTGFNAALMAHIVGEAGKVMTVDIDEDIVAGARKHLAEAGFERVKVICGDGGYGYSEQAPYDRIILTAGVSDITPAWHEQLKPGGRMIVPLAFFPGGEQRIIAFERSDQCLVSTAIINGGFMLLRGEFSGPHPVGSRRIQLSPEPGLQLYLRDDDQREIDSEAIFQLLTGPKQDLPTGIQVTAPELSERYATWSALLDLNQPYRDLECLLSAKGEMANKSFVPFLFGIPGKFCSTRGLLKEGSLAVYVRQIDHALPQRWHVRQKEHALPEAWPENEQPFEIWVRSYGPDETLATYLIDHMRGWDAAGRPLDEKKWRFRAYRQEAEYIASANEIVIERQFTRLVIDW